MAERHPIIDARADRIRKAMAAESYGSVGDLICDILHYCDVEALDFDEMVENGRYHYVGETGKGDDIEASNREMFEENGGKFA